jgi:hypothetical protein
LYVILGDSYFPGNRDWELPVKTRFLSPGLAAAAAVWNTASLALHPT